MGLPTNPAATGAVSDPALAELLAFRDEAPFVQLYFDTAFGENIGGAMNDAIALMFAGEASPEDIVEASQTAADSE
jgi:raffinose/stachyose/melibiose transport system substrate-binding protein